MWRPAPPPRRHWNLAPSQTYLAASTVLRKFQRLPLLAAGQSRVPARETRASSGGCRRAVGERSCGAAASSPHQQWPRGAHIAGRQLPRDRNSLGAATATAPGTEGGVAARSKEPPRRARTSPRAPRGPLGRARGRDIGATDLARRPVLTGRAHRSARSRRPIPRSPRDWTEPAPQLALPPQEEARRDANALPSPAAPAEQPRRDTMRPPAGRPRLPLALMLLAALLVTGRGYPLRKRGPGPHGHSRMAEVSDERDWWDDGQEH